MLINILNMLIYWVRPRLKNPMAPTLFTHRIGNETWQVIVARINDQQELRA